MFHIGGSDEWSQHMFSIRNTKNYHTFITKLTVIFRALVVSVRWLILCQQNIFESRWRWNSSQRKLCPVAHTFSRNDFIILLKKKRNLSNYYCHQSKNNFSTLVQQDLYKSFIYLCMYVFIYSCCDKLMFFSNSTHPRMMD